MAEMETKQAGRDNGKTRAEMQRFSEDIQQATRRNADAAARSLGEVNKGLQAIASEWTEYSKQTVEEGVRAFQQLLGARSLGQLIEAQAQFASRALDRNVSSVTKLTEMYLATMRQAAEPIGQESNRQLNT
jgi:phasin family protein